MWMNAAFVGGTGVLSAFIIHNTNTTPVVTAPPPVEIPKVEFKAPSWKCPDCTPEEQYVLSELQEHTRITDRNALATIMGCLLYTSPSPRDATLSRMPSSA